MSAGKKAGVRAEGGQVTGEVGGGRPCGQVEGHGAGARAGERPDRAVCRRRRRWAQSGDRECGDACEENQHHHAGEDDDLASRRACSVPGGVGRRGGRVGRLVDGHGRSFLLGCGLSRPRGFHHVSPRCAGGVLAISRQVTSSPWQGQAGYRDRGTCRRPLAFAGTPGWEPDRKPAGLGWPACSSLAPTPSRSGHPRSSRTCEACCQASTAAGRSPVAWQASPNSASMLASIQRASGFFRPRTRAGPWR